MVSWLPAWRSEPNVNKLCTEAEEGSRTINKIKPIISSAALAVSVFQAAVKKKKKAAQQDTEPFYLVREQHKRLPKDTHSIYVSLHIVREIRLKVCEYLEKIQY